MFALTDGTLIVWTFSLHSVAAKSIRAKIRAVILQPRRKYYFSGWFVLSLIFLSSHHHRDMEASVGKCAFHRLSPDERGFPVWYAVKVIWFAVMFLYNMHCQAKTGKHFFPKTHFSFCSSLLPPRTYCTYVNIILFQRAQHYDAFWSEMKTESVGDSKKTFRVAF